MPHVLQVNMFVAGSYWERCIHSRVRRIIGHKERNQSGQMTPPKAYILVCDGRIILMRWFVFDASFEAVTSVGRRTFYFDMLTHYTFDVLNHTLDVSFLIRSLVLDISFWYVKLCCASHFDTLTYTYRIFSLSNIIIYSMFMMMVLSKYIYTYMKRK